MERESSAERERGEVTQWDSGRASRADREMDAERSQRWGDGVMIRSQIPLEPSCRAQKPQTDSERRRNRPAVRVHVGGGGGGVDYRSLRLQNHALPQHLSLDRRGAAARSHQWDWRSPKDVINLMFGSLEAAGGGEISSYCAKKVQKYQGTCEETFQSDHVRFSLVH